MVVAGRVISSVIVDGAAVTTSVIKLVKAGSVISCVIVEVAGKRVNVEAGSVIVEGPAHYDTGLFYLVPIRPRTCISRHSRIVRDRILGPA